MVKNNHQIEIRNKYLYIFLVHKDAHIQKTQTVQPLKLTYTVLTVRIQ